VQLVAERFGIIVLQEVEVVLPKLANLSETKDF